MVLEASLRIFPVGFNNHKLGVPPIPFRDLLYDYLSLMGFFPEMCLFRVSSPCFKLLLFLLKVKLILRFIIALTWFVCFSHFLLLLV